MAVGEGHTEDRLQARRLRLEEYMRLPVRDADGMEAFSVSLGPNTGNPGRQMIRRVAIASVLAAILAFAVVPSGAMANPVLSGYGGPGAGEQMIIGSTLLTGPSKSVGSSGRGRSAGVGVGATPSVGASRTDGGAGTAGSIGGGTNVSAVPAAGGGAGSAVVTSTGSVSTAGSARSVTGVELSGKEGGSRQTVRALTPGRITYSPASTETPVLGVGIVDLAELLVAVVGLVALGFLTVRVARVRS